MSKRTAAHGNRPQAAPTPAVSTRQNNFVKGLKTEYTGLNFPEDACLAASNCMFNRIGNINTRKGIDYETNSQLTSINRNSNAISSFIWTNAGGDGNTKVYVLQVGVTLYFYQISNANIGNPVSTTKLASTINLANYIPNGSTVTPNGIECQYTSGNGYLFVVHPNLEPFFCTYSGGTVTPTQINIQIRDFIGIQEGNQPDSYRPTVLTAEHQYNLLNQGWTNSPAWSTTSNTSNTYGTGVFTFVVASATGIVLGDQVIINNDPSTYGFGGLGSATMIGNVTNIAGTTLTINVISTNGHGTPFNGGGAPLWDLNKQNGALITSWFGSLGTYPSNSDIWWTFKNASGVFSPGTTIGNVTLNSGPAPKGFNILNAFNQQRRFATGISGLTDVVTFVRPRTCTWFSGRVFYAGADASFTAQGDAAYYTWTENIYFSQIVQKATDINKCYETNDPTSETLSQLLPTDGGVIVIQGSGSIYKLFALQNGILVFAANGIWFITGGQGIGFSATDYTVTRISGIQSISSTSMIDVLGYPVFWNADGIYMVHTSMDQAQAALGGSRAGLTVENITLPSIATFYNNIPLDSKRFARGDYNPITGVIQWCYRSTQETDITSRYSFDTILNFCMFTQAFYPWTISTSPCINDIKYITYPQLGAPPNMFKYLTSVVNGLTYNFTFSEEKDNVLWADWNSTGTPVNYVSSFTAGYQLHGEAVRKFQPQYVYMYSNNASANSYKIQGIWNYANDPNSGKYSTLELVSTNLGRFAGVIRRHRIRGNGYVFQLSIASADGLPFDFMGWAFQETPQQSV